MGRTLVGLIVLISLTHSSFAVASKWKWITACGQAVISAASWLRRNPDAQVDDQTRALADLEIPPTGNSILDWLAGIRSYLNPNVAALITRGAQIVPEFTNTNAPKLIGETTAEREDLWRQLLSTQTALDDFEELLPKALEILVPEERLALAKWHFTRGIMSAVRDPNDTENDQLKRAVMLMRADGAIRQGIADQMPSVPGMQRITDESN